MIRRVLILLAAVGLVILHTACLHRIPSPAPAAKSADWSRSDFIDLQPDWTVRVITPILRSGGYVLPSLKAKAEGNTMNLEAGDDFLGYQKDYYKITTRRDGGIRIRFSQGELWEHGRTRKAHKPLLALFEQAAHARHIRLVYLVRVSHADHDMAIVSSENPRDLDEVTGAVTAHAECLNLRTAVCRWVPNGVAVTPER